MKNFEAIEKMGQLIKVISQHSTGTDNKIKLSEAIADVEIVLEELVIDYSMDGLVAVQKSKKIKEQAEEIII